MGGHRILFWHVTKIIGLQMVQKVNWLAALVFCQIDGLGEYFGGKVIRTLMIACNT